MVALLAGAGVAWLMTNRDATVLAAGSETPDEDGSGDPASEPGAPTTTSSAGPRTPTPAATEATSPPATAEAEALAAAASRVVVTSDEIRPAPSSDATAQQPASASASATAPSGVDASGATVTYDAANLIDGDPETAWRVPGDGTGVQLRFSFVEPVHLTEIGLIPGYAKVDPFDGTDRFQENRRVRSARYTLDDGTSREATFTDVAQLQSVPVDATTTNVTVTITSTSEPGERDFTPVSEVVFRGAPPAVVPDHMARGGAPQRTIQEFLTRVLAGADATEHGTAAAIDGARGLTAEAGDDAAFQVSSCQVETPDELICNTTISGPTQSPGIDLRLSWPPAAQVPRVVAVTRAQSG